MSEPRWQPLPSDLAADRALRETILDCHRSIYENQFAGDPMANPGLGLECRAFRRLQDWRLLLLLTPWMLSRLLFPDRDPGIAIPEAWDAERRRQADYQVLGPAVQARILGHPQKAHLNYQAGLGHYLLQPICLNLRAYRSAGEVFAAWDRVIRTRDENMEKYRKDCPWQREISRRELFVRLRGRDR